LTCQIVYTYTVQLLDDGDTLTNTVTVETHPVGFDNDIDDLAFWEVDLLHPSWTIDKSCISELVPLEGPAEWTVAIANTGDADLVFVLDEDVVDSGSNTITAGTEIAVAVSESKIYTVTITGDFSGQTSITNTINADISLHERYGLDNFYEEAASDTCDIGSRVDLVKLTNGDPTTSITWTFEIYNGPDGFGSTVIVSDTTPPALLDFGNINLDPAATYTLCELEVPPDYATSWAIDNNNNGVIDAGDTLLTPYNPDAPTEDLGNRCIDFGANTDPSIPLVPGETLHLIVDNDQEGGSPRTPGYWKNWNGCTGGMQQYTAEKNGGWEQGFWLVEDVLAQSYGGAIVWDDINTDDPFEFRIDGCEVAVDLLDKRMVVDPNEVGDGRKKASDPLHNLAAHLLAAQLNFGADACTTPQVQDWAEEAETLLDTYNFDGDSHDLLGKKSPDALKAKELAGYLDDYNNGAFCGDTNP
jgi:hypothetical protein